MLKQRKFWKFSKVTAKPKVMEKLMESHGIWRAQKGMNADLCWYLQEVPQVHVSHVVVWLWLDTFFVAAEGFVLLLRNVMES